MLRLTIDTNALDPADLTRLTAAAKGRAEIATTTVTDRELRGSDIPSPGNSIFETAVWDESSYGNAVYGGPETEELFERIIHVISAGTLPGAGMRESMTPGQQRQLRDAMILEAHSRAGRDILVTKDVKGFIHHGRRETLEQLCGTRIMTVDEACTFLQHQQLGA